MGNASLIGISTLRDEVNFYTKLIKLKDKITGLPIFTCKQIKLACEECIEKGKGSECVHRLHLVPQWQSADRHVQLKTIMQDRPDLIESELSGLAFDSCQQVFKAVDINIMFSQAPPAPLLNEAIHIFIDPAAGGPQSDYAVLSITRQKGLITVSLRAEISRANVIHEFFKGNRLVLDKRGYQHLIDLVVKNPSLTDVHWFHIGKVLKRFGDNLPHMFILIQKQYEFSPEFIKRILVSGSQPLEQFVDDITPKDTRNRYNRRLY